jgi:hypothetical protein
MPGTKDSRGHPKKANHPAAVGSDILAIPEPLDRLVGLLRQEMRRLSSEPQRIRVFFEFWSAGIWSRPIRVRMQAELDRYRHAFRPMAAEVISANRERFRSSSSR